MSIPEPTWWNGGPDEGRGEHMTPDGGRREPESRPATVTLTCDQCHRDVILAVTLPGTGRVCFCSRRCRAAYAATHTERTSA